MFLLLKSCCSCGLWRDCVCPDFVEFRVLTCMTILSTIREMCACVCSVCLSIADDQERADVMFCYETDFMLSLSDHQ